MFNLKIGTRLGAGFAVLVLLIGITGGVGINRMATVNAAMEEMLDQDQARLNKAAEWAAGVRSNGLRTLLLFKTYDPDAQNAIQAEIDLQSDHNVAAREFIAARVDSQEEQRLFDTLKGVRDAYIALRDKVAEMRVSGDMQEATTIANTELMPATNAYAAAVDAIRDHIRDDLEVVRADIAQDYRVARSVMLAGIAISIILAGVIAVAMTRSIVRPIGAALRMAESVSSGNLTARPDIVPSGDETGLLLQALDRMQDNLTDVVRTIRTGAESIKNASSEIASGNLNLSARTEQQASSLEQTAASMEELTENVRKNAENAMMATKLTNEAAVIANKGGDVVAKVEDRMARIDESSQKIASITGVIDGIAFQTNILALNAAVEAARAGEQGRGFAVVASEVRSLAQRSAQAAKEIQELISDSVETVAASSQFVSQAGGTMRDIMKSVDRLNQVMEEISAAGREQSEQIGQVNQAIVQMDAMTQHNAALVEEAAAASSSMQEQATELVKSVSVFSVSNVSTRISSLPVAPSRGSREVSEVRQLESV